MSRPTGTVRLTLTLAVVLSACGDEPATVPRAAAGEHLDEAHHGDGDDVRHGDDDEHRAEGAFDERSLFRLDLSLEDQAGQPFTLVSRRGQPVLLTFFYASCDTMCPLILSDLQRIEAGLTPAARAALRVVVVSIDPEHDDVAHLASVARERGLPLDRWSLVRGSERDVRTLASTLGMTYRRTTDGGYAHAALFTLLDGEGRVVTQISGTGRTVAPLVEGVEALVEP